MNHRKKIKKRQLKEKFYTISYKYGIHETKKYGNIKKYKRASSSLTTIHSNILNKNNYYEAKKKKERRSEQKNQYKKEQPDVKASAPGFIIILFF